MWFLRVFLRSTDVPLRLVAELSPFLSERERQRKKAELHEVFNKWVAVGASKLRFCSQRVRIAHPRSGKARSSTYSHWVGPPKRELCWGPLRASWEDGGWKSRSTVFSLLNYQLSRPKYRRWKGYKRNPDELSPVSSTGRAK